MIWLYFSELYTGNCVVVMSNVFMLANIFRMIKRRMGESHPRFVWSCLYGFTSVSSSHRTYVLHTPYLIALTFEAKVTLIKICIERRTRQGFSIEQCFTVMINLSLVDGVTFYVASNFWSTRLVWIVSLLVKYYSSVNRLILNELISSEGHTSHDCTHHSTKVRWTSLFSVILCDIL